MCGLIAMIPRTRGGFFSKDQDIFRQLLVLDGEFRGLDATGVFQVQKNRQVYTVKAGQMPQMFMEMTAYQKFNDRMLSSSHLVVGHNRKATQGAKVSKNAHPFHEGNIILVHNGTLINHKTLAETEVDSHAITKALDKDPPSKVIQELDGAFALIWYDVEKEKLFAVRNKERPLALVETDNMWVLISEPWMAHAIMSRNMVDMSKATTTVLEPGDLYEFDPFAMTMEVSKVELKKEWTSSRTPDWENVTRIPRYIPTQKTLNGSSASNSPKAVLHNAVVGAFKCDTKDCETVVESTIERNVISKEVLFDAYKPGDRILIKVLAMDQKSVGMSGRITKVKGVTVTPGRPVVDFTGEIFGITPNEFPDYFEDFCEASVMNATHTVNGGASIGVHRIAISPRVELADRSFMPLREWEYVANNNVCSHCQAEIDIKDHIITEAVRRGIGLDAKYDVKCYDCITEEEDTEVEKTNKDSTVQVGQQQQHGPQQGTRAIVVKGPDTVQ